MATRQPLAQRAQAILDSRPCYGRIASRSEGIILSRYAEIMRHLSASLPFSGTEWEFVACSVGRRCLAFVERPDRAQALPSAIYQSPVFWAHEVPAGVEDPDRWRGTVRQKLMSLSPLQRLALQDQIERFGWAPNRKQPKRNRVVHEYPADLPAHGRLPMIRDQSFTPRLRTLTRHKWKKIRIRCPCCRQRIAPGKQRIWYRFQPYHPWCLLGIWRHNPHVLLKILQAVNKQRPGYWNSRIVRLSELGFLEEKQIVASSGLPVEKPTWAP